MKPSNCLQHLPYVSLALQKSDRGGYSVMVKCLTALALSLTSAPSLGDNFAGAANAQTSHSTMASSSVANHTPVANTDFVTLEKSSTAFNVLTNDTDADGNRLIIVNATAKFGAIAFTPDGLIGYAQNPGQPQEDKITYIVSDGVGGSAIGTVEVLIDQNNNG